MARFRLIYDPQDHVSFGIPWVRPRAETLFELAQYVPGQKYQPGLDFALVTYASRISNRWWTNLHWQGCGVVIDHLWDSDVVQLPRIHQRELELYCPNWMWYLACIEFSFHGYESYRPQRRQEKAFLMLMNQQRWHRTWLLNRLDQLWPSGLYSYHEQGIVIEGDKPSTDYSTPWQRYMNPDWYNRTAFSIVAESYMRDTYHSGGVGPEVSEKIFKPLAYFHPFVVAGSQHTLQYLHSQGFVTYDNWFDESYDSVRDDHIRLAMVGRQAEDAIRRWNQQDLPWDRETEQRAEHNHYHMFNHDLVSARFQQEILNPVQEFCECYGH